MLGNNNLIDPYLEWAVTTRFAYLNGRWFRVLLELNRSASSFRSMVKEMEADDFITVPSIYETAPNSLSAKNITFCMAIMSREALEALVTEEEPSGTDPRILARTHDLVKANQNNRAWYADRKAQGQRQSIGKSHNPLRNGRSTDYGRKPGAKGGRRRDR